MRKQFKTNNPYRPDQQILQEIEVGQELAYDYSDSKWVGIDTEFLSFTPELDELCAIQVSSADPQDDQKIRVEIIHVYKGKADSKLVDLLTNENIEKIFHVFQADMPRVEKFIGERIKGRIFDTQMAARVCLTNIDSTSMESLINYLVDPKFKENKKATSSEWDRTPEEWEEDQFRYAAEDVLYLNPLRLKLLAVAERRGKTELLEEVMSILPTVAQLIKKGYAPNLFGY